MRQLAHLPEIENCSKVFLENVEKPRGLYLCWQENTRLGYVKIDPTKSSTPQYLKLTAVSELKALSKYLFAASNSSILFWAPENLQTPPSVFIELPKAARIVSFTFHDGRFLLLWTLNFRRKVFVTLTNKKAQVLAQREIPNLAVYDLDFLELPEPPFLIETAPGRAWITLSDGTLWSASLEEDSLAEFIRVENLHSPAVWISQRSDTLHIISCLGRFYSVSSGLNVSEKSCVAPVLRVFHSEDSVLIVTPSDSFVLELDGDGSFRTSQSRWHGTLSVAKCPEGYADLICVSRSGIIYSCAKGDFFRGSSLENDNDNRDPWEKLRKLADLRETRALAQVADMDSVQRQMALLMYIKFKALVVHCNVSQHYYHSLIEDHVVTCRMRTEEAFDTAMWVASVVLKPHGGEVAMAKSAPFNPRGTSISLQFEYPRSLLLNLSVFVSLRSRFMPRTLSLLIHEQDICSRNSRYENPSLGFLVHRPSIECCLAEDLRSFLHSIAGDSEACSTSDVGQTKLARIVLSRADVKQTLSLRAVLMKMLIQKTFSLEPKFLIPKSMERAVKASKEQIQNCDSMEALMICYEEWRSFTLKLPLL